MNEIDSIDTRFNEETPLEAIAYFPLNSDFRWQDAMRHYGRKFPFIFFDKWAMKKFQATRNWLGNPSELGLLALINWDLIQGSAASRKALQEALNAPSGAKRFPKCYGMTNSYGPCMSWAFEVVMSSLYPSFGEEVPEFARLGAAEATLLLKIGGLLPASWSESRSTQDSAQEIIRSMRAREGFSKAAAHLFRVIDAIDPSKAGGVNNLDRWRKF